MGKIYMFDNNTGREIPEKIDTQKVDLLLGSTVTDIHNNILNKSSMLCIFTKIADSDFIVPTEKEAERLRGILDFGNYNYTVEVKKSSIWYTNKVDKNIIISDSVKLDVNKLSYLLAIYLNFINPDGSPIRKPGELYIVKNTRNSKEICKTPKYDEAISVCNQSPCTVIIKNSTQEVIYKSQYGKVPVTYTLNNTKSKFKNKIGIKFNV